MAPVVFKYVTSNNGTIHLVPQDDMLRGSPLTVCGRFAGGWISGDETISGIASTCSSCSVVRKPGAWGNRSPERHFYKDLGS